MTVGVLYYYESAVFYVVVYYPLVSVDSVKKDFIFIVLIQLIAEKIIIVFFLNLTFGYYLNACRTLGLILVVPELKGIRLDKPQRRSCIGRAVKAADLFLITEKDRRARLPSRNSKVLLLFYTARGYSADDILGQNQIDNDDREDGECDHRQTGLACHLQPR